MSEYLGDYLGDFFASPDFGAGTSTNSALAYVDLSDGQWTFRLRHNGRLEIIAGPNNINVGRVYLPTDSAHTQVLANLRAVSAGQRTKIDSFLQHTGQEQIGNRVKQTQPTVVTAPSTPGSASSGSSGKANELPSVYVSQPVISEELSVPLTERPWFLPAVIGGTVIGLGLIWFALPSKK